MTKFKKLKNNRQTYPCLSYNLYYTKPVVVYQTVQLLRFPSANENASTLSEDDYITEEEVDSLIQVINEVNQLSRLRGRKGWFSLNL